ncbi:nuclear transport factor 2 family protein [Rhodococcus sp. 14-2470-1a]|uniref:nuclear transport factor 2 family protein n=1 Tax=Rhodococcus sp. 14-2470-1a TaxID=2023150 RepID=UPI000B9B8531|nr:nuclear transport factor 2 family protein [Rhodococcus sp. 14-2470-1a]OZF45770.1 hypothetical protein CH292_21210 [Rhodococcus sp. 14-2470-1a]
MSTSTATDVSAVEGVMGAIATYAHALDEGRTSDVVALFTTDGVSEIAGYGTFSGPEEIGGAYGNLVPTVPQRHMTGNTVVTVVGAHEATASSDFVFFTRGELGWGVQLAGHYEDSLRFQDGKWLFSKRLTSFDM